MKTTNILLSVVVFELGLIIGLIAGIAGVSVN